MARDKITQNHSGSGHNIVAKHVTFGAPRFEFTTALMEQVASQLDRRRPVGLMWKGGGRAERMAMSFKEFLIQRGFRISQEVTVGVLSGLNFEGPITITKNGFGLLLSGEQAVHIDPTI
ncbi:hypothetical protein GG804_27020 [Sphingomonas histidinilytica]|uniref:hypothetical protein n=1 Tax=Rhizorhabdus histidinilytica TaxID=439228 RepID=UPI001ADB57E6|nr:hypothetical protein [Rhizorhabdus histidinilytica]MBO9380420.1 hypothetical protein [Rhizorhabdus histidinilytica]